MNRFEMVGEKIFYFIGAGGEVAEQESATKEGAGLRIGIASQLFSITAVSMYVQCL